MDKYAVLIFRKTALDNARHVAFATQLGKELEQNPSYAIAERLGTAYLFDVGKYAVSPAHNLHVSERPLQHRERR